MLFRLTNLSDSSNSSSDEESRSPKRIQLKTSRTEDRATSKFYTKDGSQEDLPYVADNDFKTKKQKKNKSKKKSLRSKNQLSYEVMSCIIYCLSIKNDQLYFVIFRRLKLRTTLKVLSLLVTMLLIITNNHT